MTVTMPGFATMTKPNLKITAGTTRRARHQAGRRRPDDHSSTSPATRPPSASTPTPTPAPPIIKGADLDALSDDPDELSAELTALAGPSSGPNGGQIYVDGFTGGQLPPKSSIREIRINQNPFSAEYDKLGYGRIEVFTKPGTDKFHGSFSTQGDEQGVQHVQPVSGSGQRPAQLLHLLPAGQRHRPADEAFLLQPGRIAAQYSAERDRQPDGLLRLIGHIDDTLQPGRPDLQQFPVPGDLPRGPPASDPAGHLAAPGLRVRRQKRAYRPLPVRRREHEERRCRHQRSADRRVQLRQQRKHRFRYPIPRPSTRRSSTKPVSSISATTPTRRRFRPRHRWSCRAYLPAAAAVRRTPTAPAPTSRSRTIRRSL